VLGFPNLKNEKLLTSNNHDSHTKSYIFMKELSSVESSLKKLKLKELNSLIPYN